MQDKDLFFATDFKTNKKEADINVNSNYWEIALF